MSQVEVSLSISAEEVQKAYMGAEYVYATTTDGRSIRFPVNILWQFITHDGIHGRFLIEYTDDQKFKSIYRIG